MADELFAQLTDTLSSAKTVEELTRPLLSLLELVTELEATYLTRIELEHGIQRILFSCNTRTLNIPEGLAVPWEGTLCKRALDEGKLYTDDVPNCWGDSEAAAALGIQTYVSTPVQLDDGSLFGTLCAASSERKPLTPKGEQVLRLFASLIALHVQREQLLTQFRELNATLESYSYTDALTGLPNRRAVVAELHRLFALAERAGQSVLIGFIDLDGFKAINDTHGHEAGDEFLTEVGRRIGMGLRAGDTLGRLGGDEFIIVGMGAAPGTEGDEAADALRHRVAPLIRGAYRLSGCAFDYPGASIGVVSADPGTTTPDDALRAADAAMYVQKKIRRAVKA